MELKNVGVHNLKLRVNDDDIAVDYAGVMGDLNSRGFNLQIMGDDGSILTDETIKVQLLVKLENGKDLLFSDGTYNNGNYYVKIPDEVFIVEQTLECQFIMSKDNDKLFSHTFIRKVAKSLLGTVREGRTTMLDLEKVMSFGNNYEQRMQELNDNADNKIKQYNANDVVKTTVYNENDVNKTAAYNDNAAEKLKQYNDNTKVKTDTYNENHADKTQIYNDNAVEKLREYDENADNAIKTYNNNADSATINYNNNATQHTQAYNDNAAEKLGNVNSVKDNVDKTKSEIDGIKQDFDAKKQDFEDKYSTFDDKYTKVKAIVNNEDARIAAEQERQDFDIKLKAVFDKGVGEILKDYPTRKELTKDYYQIFKQSIVDYIKKSLINQYFEKVLVYNRNNGTYVGVFKINESGQPVIEEVSYADISSLLKLNNIEV